MTRPVAVFDLDGTLTRYDTSFPFLRKVAGERRTRAGLAVAAAWAVPDVLVAAAGEAGLGGAVRLGGVRGRWEGRFHRRVARWTLRGRPQEVVEEVGVAFARAVVKGGLRADALDRIQGHMDQDHHLVMASASLDAYVEPLATLLGFHGCVATRVAYRDGVATGGFEGEVCWGLEKLRRVQAFLGPGTEILHAYGDSPGDAPLLAAARSGTWVR